LQHSSGAKVTLFDVLSNTQPGGHWYGCGPGEVMFTSWQVGTTCVVKTATNAADTQHTRVGHYCN
jgi:hypothetical protein